MENGEFRGLLWKMENFAVYCGKWRISRFIVENGEFRGFVYFAKGGDRVEYMYSRGDGQNLGTAFVFLIKL